MSIADKTVVKDQYATSARLETRISIHEKYSRNKQPFGEWIVSHYDLQPGEKVLELGCGTGSMWQGVILPEGCHVTLTDLSAGMLETARQNTAHLHADYAVCDAMALPYEDNAFDVVIANMMLYHVPDLPKALSEVRRVLKRRGVFFCATSGEKTVVDYIREILGEEKVLPHISFTLQNGGALLARHFAHVERDIRKDGLNVTNLDDLMAYLSSLASMTGLNQGDKVSLRKALESHMQNGVLFIPKEYGTFLCR